MSGTRRPRYQHTHPGKQRADENNHDQKDLPAHADRRVASEADIVTDERVIDDPLKATNRILQNAGPRDLPHRSRDRTVDNRTIEGLTFLSRTRWGGRSGRWPRQDGSIPGHVDGTGDFVTHERTITNR